MGNMLIADSVLERQIDLELVSVRDGVTRYRKLAKEATDRGDGASLKPVERVLAHWFVPLAQSIESEQRSVAASEYGEGRHIWGPLFCELDPERMAVASLHEVLSQCTHSPLGVAMGPLAYAVGRAVLAEVYHDRLREQQKENNSRWRERGRNLPREDDERMVLDEIVRKSKRMTPKRLNWWAKKVLSKSNWSQSALIRLGDLLLWKMLDTCSADDYDRPFVKAFDVFFVPHQNGERRAIRLSGRILKIIEDGHTVRQALRPRYVPMIVRPFPWLVEEQRDGTYEIVNGGYVRIKTPLVSSMSREHRAALCNPAISTALKGLDAMSGVPMSVDTWILDIQQKAWERGGDLCGIPPRDNIELPPKLPDNATREEIAARKQERKAIYTKNIEAKSERMEYIGALTIAERFRHEERIYFPHQFDFRSRMYPIPALYNAQQFDAIRAMVRFGDKKKPDMYWVAAQAAKAYGIDKVSFDDRVKWTSDNLTHMKASVEDPFGYRWWTQADEPWQFLAACRAMFDEDAASRLVIDMDGTANGLQWYAALGRDEVAAPLVNLIPSDAPANLYGMVTQQAEAIVKSDADAGNVLAAEVLPHVVRSVVKVPTMTKTYGVTMAGARKQVMDAMAERGFTATFKHGQYLANVLLKSIGVVCRKADEIMRWLRECAQIVCNKNLPLKWTTPTGFTVVQGYRRATKFTVQTIRHQYSFLSDWSHAPVRTRKQVDAFAANLIHSYDASHMMMTAVACEEARVSLRGIHDCYGTHSATVPEMRSIVIGKFVEINKLPLLTILSEELERFANEKMPPPPPIGTFDIDQCTDRTYMIC